MLTLSILLIVEFIPRKISPGYATTSCSLQRVPLAGISLSGFLDEQTLDKITTSAGEKLWDTRLCTAFSVWMEFAPTRSNLLLYYKPPSSPQAVEEGTSNETYAWTNLNLRHACPSMKLNHYIQQ
ncbi:hypothetical protein P5V15_012911 [Pogonomyrmex californicus]